MIKYNPRLMGHPSDFVLVDTGIDLAWTDEAREASILARQANKKPEDVAKENQHLTELKAAREKLKGALTEYNLAKFDFGKANTMGVHQGTPAEYAKIAERYDAAKKAYLSTPVSSEVELRVDKDSTGTKYLIPGQPDNKLFKDLTDEEIAGLPLGVKVAIAQRMNPNTIEKENFLKQATSDNSGMKYANQNVDELLRRERDGQNLDNFPITIAGLRVLPIGGRELSTGEPGLDTVIERPQAFKDVPKDQLQFLSHEEITARLLERRQRILEPKRQALVNPRVSATMSRNERNNIIAEVESLHHKFSDAEDAFDEAYKNPEKDTSLEFLHKLNSLREIRDLLGKQLEATIKSLDPIDKAYALKDIAKSKLEKAEAKLAATKTSENTYLKDKAFLDVSVAKGAYEDALAGTVTGRNIEEAKESGTWQTKTNALQLDKPYNLKEQEAFIAKHGVQYKDLDQEQVNALEDWKFGNWEYIQNVLRSGRDVEDLKGVANTYNTVKELDGMFEFIAKPIEQPVITYRGLRTRLPDIKAGDEYTDNGYMPVSLVAQHSAPARKTLAGEQLNSGTFYNSTGARMILTLPKGTKGMFISSKHDWAGKTGEDEYLLNRGTKYKINAVRYNKNGKQIIQAEVIP